jgi:hypothetical protein
MQEILRICLAGFAGGGVATLVVGLPVSWLLNVMPLRKDYPEIYKDSMLLFKKTYAALSVFTALCTIGILVDLYG